MKIDIKGTEEIYILIIVTGSKVGAKLGITELMKIFMVEMEKIQMVLITDGRFRNNRSNKE